jgi:1-acyl-sn-glycerol-3-phosphate acyltransferase
MTANREFLLTGATGFLGKVLLEDLIRRRDELGLARVHLVIRPRPAASAVARFEREVLSSPCLSRLPPGWTDAVAVVEGTLEQPDLGLSPAVREDLERRVTHIVHAAASVSFDLPLAEAARSNVTTTLHLLELARRFTRLERLGYVSTAYVTPHPGGYQPIPEALAPLPLPAEELYQAIQAGTFREAELLARSRHPNTYTLTKSLAEHLLVGRRGALPLAIVRPSIISAAWQHPFPGWIDSMAGFAGFVVMIGLGHLRAVVGSPDTRLDLIPVDLAARGVIAACLEDSPPEQVLIRHVVAGLERSPRLRDCRVRIRSFFSMHRVDRPPAVHYLGPRGWRYHLADALHHRLAVRLAAWRSPRLRRAGARLLARLSELNRVFPYFTSRSFAFETSQPVPAGFEPVSYVTTVCRGIYRHILGRDDTEWVLAGSRHRHSTGDLRWALTQPAGTLWIRFAAWLATGVLRRSVDRVTVDLPSFERARDAAPEGEPVVLVPNHRSYLDFVLCSYLCFARPDLRIGIPHIAAAIEFGRIPLLGWMLTRLHAFYVQRGTPPDPELTRRVHRLVEEGRTLEFFVEGQRSRSREFLSPKRGLLRCLQDTGRTFTLLPVTFSYDRVPEEAAFASELAGRPKPKMRLTGLFRWAAQVWRGQVQLGRIHIACGAPVRMTPESDLRAVSREIIARLEQATVATTFHLDAFLSCYSLDGLDSPRLRHEIEQRGGRVLESPLRYDRGLDPGIAYTFRCQFHHLFRTADGRFEPLVADIRRRAEEPREPGEPGNPDNRPAASRHSFAPISHS